MTLSTCAVWKELYCSKLMAIITSQELRGSPAHFSHGSLASRWTGCCTVFAWVAAMYALILWTSRVYAVLIFINFTFVKILIFGFISFTWPIKLPLTHLDDSFTILRFAYILFIVSDAQSNYWHPVSVRHKPVPRLLFDVWWLPGDKRHLLGKAYDMLPCPRAQL